MSHERTAPVPGRLPEPGGLPEPSSPSGQPPPAGLTFNVVFMPGSPGRLLPFALSLLQGAGVRVRLVANGCDPEEHRLIRAATELDDRVSAHVLAGPEPIAHGVALNQLFEEFPEPYFAIADSDLIASGDFMTRLWPLAPGQAAVFSAPPVWATDDEVTVPRDCTYLGGRHRMLHDGTPVGTTYMAIYERAALEPAWRAAPRGFAAQERYLLPRALQAALSERGWVFRWFDTCRLVNLQLSLAGFRLEHRNAPELHHVGWLGAAHDAPRVRLASALRTLLQTVRSNEGSRLQRTVDGAVHARYLFRRRQNPIERRIDIRRPAVLSYVHAVLDAMAAGEPVPPAPPTDSPEVDRRLGALVRALETHYRAGVSALRAATSAAERKRV
jgi:hypothetical protein